MRPSVSAGQRLVVRADAVGVSPDVLRHGMDEDSRFGVELTVEWRGFDPVVLDLRQARLRFEGSGARAAGAVVAPIAAGVGEMPSAVEDDVWLNARLESGRPRQVWISFGPLPRDDSGLPVRVVLDLPVPGDAPVALVLADPPRRPIWYADMPSVGVAMYVPVHVAIERRLIAVGALGSLVGWRLGSGFTLELGSGLLLITSTAPEPDLGIGYALTVPLRTGWAFRATDRWEVGPIVGADSTVGWISEGQDDAIPQGHIVLQAGVRFGRDRSRPRLHGPFPVLFPRSPFGQVGFDVAGTYWISYDGADGPGLMLSMIVGL